MGAIHRLYVKYEKALQEIAKSHDQANHIHLRKIAQKVLDEAMEIPNE